jgi:hypothetical protein
VLPFVRRASLFMMGLSSRKFHFVWSNKRSIFFCIVRTEECSFSWTYPRG